MASQLAPSQHGYDVSSSALEGLTDRAQNYHEDPKSHIHLAANNDKGSLFHKFIHHILPDHLVESLENKLHLGNYVIDRRTGEKSWESMSIYVRLGMHLLFYGNEEEKLLHWKRTLALLEAQSVKMGQQYDSPDSKAHILPFIRSFNLESSMSEMIQPDPNGYATFNEFFAREIREDARPIAEPENDLVTSSPADCRLTAFPTVDMATRYWIKGATFTLARLLGNEQLAQHFDGGAIVIARLAPQDYHRWHAPVSGVVESIMDIPGAYYTVNPQAINENLDVFCENKRSIMTLRRAATESLVAIVAVGAMLVGSIKYNPGMDQIGTAVRRGQCLGSFHYGGSTVIVVYPRGEVVLDEDLVRNSTEQNCETLMKVGWRVGVKA